MTVASTILFLWAVVLAIVSVYASQRALLRRAAPLGQASLGVLVVRPLRGAEPFLARTLASFPAFGLHVRAACRFAVEHAGDGASTEIPGALAALRARGVPARAVVTRARGPNRKAAQIAAVLAVEASATDVIIVVDSDVDLERIDLGKWLAPFDDPKVAAVWVPPVEEGPVTALGDRASQAVHATSLHAFPLLAAIDGRGLTGKAVALRVTALESIGGFDPLTFVLGEDMELGRRFAAQGYRVVSAPFVVPSLRSGASFGASTARFARWLTVIRRQRPWLLPSYPALFFATPLVIVCALSLLPFAPVHAMGSLSIALGARLLVACAARVCASPSPRFGGLTGDMVLSDVLLLVAFFQALRRTTVSWRGRQLNVARGGRLSEVT